MNDKNSLESVNEFTQDIRRALVEKCFSDGELNDDSEEFLLKIVNSMDTSSATKRKLTIEEVSANNQESSRAIVLEAMLGISKSTGMSMPVDDYSDPVASIDAPVLPDAYDTKILDGELASEKKFDSLNDFNDSFADSYRDSLSQ